MWVVETGRPGVAFCLLSVFKSYFYFFCLVSAWSGVCLVSAFWCYKLAANWQTVWGWGIRDGRSFQISFLLSVPMARVNNRVGVIDFDVGRRC